MSNKENYKKTFIEALSIKEDQFNENIKYNDISEWDSIGHMQMIAELEDAFEIELEMDDIINFSSYNKGMGILAKYGIEVN